MSRHEHSRLAGCLVDLRSAVAWLSGLYNVVYVIPLLVITVVFAYTLGSRKLSEPEGRLLKLVSGTMILGLGILLIAAPAALNDLRVVLVLLVGSIGFSGLVHWLRKPALGGNNE